jgi:hypothetical protein
LGVERSILQQWVVNQLYSTSTRRVDLNSCCKTAPATATVHFCDKIHNISILILGFIPKFPVFAKLLRIFQKTPNLALGPFNRLIQKLHLSQIRGLCVAAESNRHACIARSNNHNSIPSSLPKQRCHDDIDDQPKLWNLLVWVIQSNESNGKTQPFIFKHLQTQPSKASLVLCQRTCSFLGFPSAVLTILSHQDIGWCARLIRCLHQCR